MLALASLFTIVLAVGRVALLRVRTGVVVPVATLISALAEETSVTVQEPALIVASSKSVSHAFTRTTLRALLE